MRRHRRLPAGGLLAAARLLAMASCTKLGLPEKSLTGRSGNVCLPGSELTLTGEIHSDLRSIKFASMAVSPLSLARNCLSELIHRIKPRSE